MPFLELPRIVIDTAVRELCYRPYPNHPKGCPNYNKKKDCPPQAKFIYETLKGDSPIYAIWNCYDFARHVAKMKRLHPEWSKRQVECCLYWQPTARKSLKAEIQLFKAQYPALIVIGCPEGQGVNISATMQSIGVELEWPPVTVTYQVAIAGTRNTTHESLFPCGQRGNELQ